MGFLRLIIWGLIFYIVAKLVRSVSKILKTGSIRDPLQQAKPNVNNKLNIDKRDIIEAEFEEVKSTKDSK